MSRNEQQGLTLIDRAHARPLLMFHGRAAARPLLLSLLLLAP